MKISVHFDRYKFYLSFKMNSGNTAQSIGNRANNAIGILTLVHRRLILPEASSLWIFWVRLKLQRNSNS